MMDLVDKWHKTKKTVYESEHSTYSRSTGIQIGMYKCEICKEEKEIMSIDTSDGEYNSFDCCKSCLDKLWGQA